jgi:hypothetical protein
VRTVTTTKPAPVSTRWSTSAADVGSEELRVVNAEHDRAAARALAEAVGHLAHHLERALRHGVVRHQGDEGVERHRGRAAGGLHPGRVRAVGAGGGHRMAREARLAHAGCRGHRDAGVGRVAAQRGDALELLLAADQRPTRAPRAPAAGGAASPAA